MESNWKNVNLGNYAKITMGQSPESQFYNEELNGIPFLQGSKTFGDIFPKIEKYTTKTTKLASENSIIFSVRAPVGDVNIAPTELCIGRGLAALESRNNRFLYYLLKFNKFKYESYSSGTVFSSINKKSLETMIVRIPNEKNQDKIAEILWNLDSKIELNNQIISNLEELASTLFKRWFVDFEFPDENGNPYKSSGGKMVDSELGEIPEGWEINPLSSIAKITSGKRPDVKKTNPDKDNIIPIVGASKIMGYTNQVLENGSIITTGRVGTHGIIQRYREKVWVSDNSFIIKSDTEEFLNQILLRIDYKNLNRGSTQPLITQTDLKKYKIILPSSKFIEMFESVISKLTECEFQIKKQNLNLEKIRDSLLPKLLSGEIELPEDEEV
ncbi:restriction endonuclease subunit S [Enterococcus hirae]